MKTMTFKKLATASAIALAVIAAPAANSAAVVNSLLTPGAINSFQDTNVDRFLRADTTGTIVLGGVNYKTLSGTDTITKGDIIQSLLQFTDTNSGPIANNPGGFGAPYGLLAYSELVIGDITTFTDGFGNSFDSYNVSASGNLGANVLVNIYENGIGSDNQFLNTLFSGTADAGIAEATDAGFIASFGLKEADDFWQIRTPAGTLSVLLNQGENSPQAGVYELGLSVLSNPGALPILANGIVSSAPGHVGTFNDVVGNGSGFKLVSGTNADWQISTNTKVSFLTTNVPEPELISLLSIGLIAGGFASRRRNA